jgi:DNA-binding phage protein
VNAAPPTRAGAEAGPPHARRHTKRERRELPEHVARDGLRAAIGSRSEAARLLGRKAAKLGFAKVAKAAGLSERLVRMLVAGERIDPHCSTMHALEAAHGIPFAAWTQPAIDCEQLFRDDVK